MIEGISASFLIVQQLFNISLPMSSPSLSPIKFISRWVDGLPFVLIRSHSHSQSFSFTVLLVHSPFYCNSLPLFSSTVMIIHCCQVVNLQCINSHALANAYNVSCHMTAAGALDDHRQASGQEQVYRHCYSTSTIQHGIKPALTPYAVRQCINPALMIQH